MFQYCPILERSGIWDFKKYTFSLTCILMCQNVKEVLKAKLSYLVWDVGLLQRERQTKINSQISAKSDTVVDILPLKDSL